MTVCCTTELLTFRKKLCIVLCDEKEKLPREKGFFIFCFVLKLCAGFERDNFSHPRGVMERGRGEKKKNHIGRCSFVVASAREDC